VRKLSIAGQVAVLTLSDWPVIKDLLPPYETLITEFPETQNVIKQAYEDE
jgi:hypothetical protein